MKTLLSGPGHDASWDDAPAGTDDAAAGHDAAGHDDGRRNGSTRNEEYYPLMN